MDKKFSVPAIIKKAYDYVFPVAAPGQFGRGQDVAEQKKDLSRYITPIQLQRLRHDILMWREAVSEAEAPYFPHRVRMQRMFIDTILNGHVEACMLKRKNLTMLKEFKICDDAGNEVERFTRMLKKKWFFDFMSYSLDSLFFGYSLISLGDIVNDEFPNLKVIKRHHISPDRLNVTSMVYSLSGARFLEGDYADWHVWIPTSSRLGISPCGYGLLYSISMYDILIRNNLGFNADFVELFAQPYRVAKTPKTGEDERAQLEMALQKMGSQGYAVIDPQDEIEFKESSLGGTGYKSYDNLEKRCENKISKLILGHADAMDSTPGKLGSGQGGGGKGPEPSSPVQDALSEIQINDARFFEPVVNDQLLPKMRNLGIYIPEGLHFEFKNDQEAEEFRQREDNSNMVTATIFQTIEAAGGELDEEAWKYFADRTGIPVKKTVDPPAPPPMNGKPDPSFSQKMKNKLNKLYNKR